MKKNILMDSDFLYKLDRQKNKELFAKIILLTNDELPVYEMQGKITSGSINIDGASAVRRTCSLSMVSPEVDINNTYWALKNKFKLSVGITNTVDSKYPELIWFDQGIFVFTSLSMSVSSNNFSISLQGKDKMCLLNGEVGGTINASTDFGQIEEYTTLENGEIIIEKTLIPIVDIIKNAVHLYAGEPLHNIVINDVENYGLELLEYRGDKPMYMLRNIETQVVSNITLNGNKTYYVVDKEGEYVIDEEGKKVKVELSKISNYYNLSPTANNKDATIIKSGEEKYQVIKLEKFDTAGYRKTDLTYPGELIANVGESIVSILDKIKNIFSDFEYFYDIDGRFIFQKKKNYVNTSWNNIVTSTDEQYVQDASNTSAITYYFEEGVLLTAFSNSPNILNIRNDFSIWGSRKGITGAEIPIHMRYAVDLKPQFYRPIRFNYIQVQDDQKNETDYNQKKYYIRKSDDEYVLSTSGYNSDTTYYIQGEQKSNAEIKPFVVEELGIEGYVVDWREIIYQMALDYYKYNHILEDFLQCLAKANSEYYPLGQTGYETYYIDVQGFWRELYNPGMIYNELFSYEEERQVARLACFENDQIQEDSDKKLNSIDEVTEEMVNDWLKTNSVSDYYKDNEIYKDNGWNPIVEESPEKLNFWLDFMSVEGDFAKYAKQAIGNRAKTVNNNKITGIYFEETPSVLFLNAQDKEDLEINKNEYANMTGYTFIQISSAMEGYFSISAQGLSAKDELDSLLYQHTHFNENVTLTSVPIFHLQPNTRVFVKDNNTGINGEYIISKITIPLQYNGTSSITTSKAVERIY